MLGSRWMISAASERTPRTLRYKGWCSQPVITSSWAVSPPPPASFTLETLGLVGSTGSEGITPPVKVQYVSRQGFSGKEKVPRQVPKARRHPCHKRPFLSDLMLLLFSAQSLCRSCESGLQYW